MISSVVPQAVIGLRWMGRDFFGCRAFVVGEDLGLSDQDRPQQPARGRRRSRGQRGRRQQALRPPLIIVDFGTATTFDVVERRGQLLRRRHRARHQPVARGAASWRPPSCRGSRSSRRRA